MCVSFVRARLAVSAVCLTGLVLAAHAAPAGRSSAAQASRPNVVLIFADNMGWGEIGAYGSVRGPLTPRFV